MYAIVYVDHNFYCFSVSFLMTFQRAKYNTFELALAMQFRTLDIYATTLLHQLSFAPAMGKKSVLLTHFTMAARYSIYREYMSEL